MQVRTAEMGPHINDVPGAAFTAREKVGGAARERVHEHERAVKVDTTRVLIR